MTIGFHEQDPDTHSLSDYAKHITFRNAAGAMAFLDEPRFQHKEWVFRGQRTATWPLQSTLDRFVAELRDTSLLPRAESSIADCFRSNASLAGGAVPPPDDLLSWLALLRHHGAPSRLLDFTDSPYVGAFFAADGSFDATAAIWAIHLPSIKRSAAQLLTKYTMSALVRRHGENCLHDPSFSFSDPLVIRDVIEHGPFGGTMGVPARVVLPLDPSGPFQSNERLRRQNGLFLCQVTLYATFEHSLKNVIRQAMDEQGGSADILYKISLSPRICRDLMRDLDSRGINFATLVPGLDGVAHLAATRYRVNIVKV